MAMSPQDILNIANQNFILDNTTVDEQIEFIQDQIKSPFDGGSTNYYKRLRKIVKGDERDAICLELLGQIEDRYPLIDFDLSGYAQDVDEVFNAVYKFFVKNIQELMYKFLREYIYVSKNRKILVMDHMGSKLPNYPKEQYGKKEYYILVTKLSSIVKDIADDEELRLSKFIEYLERAGNVPMYVQKVKELLDSGIICDHGVISDVYHLFKKSDKYDSTLCKLQMDITQNIINPYLEENGLLSLRIPPVEPIEEEDDDDEDDENDESTT